MIFIKYKPQSAKRKITRVKAFYRHMETKVILEEKPFQKMQIKYKRPIRLSNTIPRQYVEATQRHVVICI